MAGGKVVKLSDRRRGSPEYLAARLEQLAARVRSGEVTGVAIAYTLASGGVSCERGTTPAGRPFDLIAAIQYLATRANVETFLAEQGDD